MTTKPVVAGMAILKGTAQAAVTAAKKWLGKFDKDGNELVDGRSLEPPLGYEPAESLADMIARAVRSHAVQELARAQGDETFEESEDFDVGDDFDPTSPYEAFFEPITEAEFNRLRDAGFTFPGEPTPKPSSPPQAAPSGPAEPGPTTVSSAPTAPAGPSTPAKTAS